MKRRLCVLALLALSTGVMAQEGLSYGDIKDPNK